MNQGTDWSPESYLKYGNERTQPSIDLVNRIKIQYQPKAIIDVGCGPGNSSKVLLDRWPNARLVGIDSSPNMIEKAKMDYPRCEWLLADAASFVSDEKFDIVYSNAAMQWIPNHESLLKRLCSLLTEHGVLAFQVPQFKDMPIRTAIDKVAAMDRWRRKTANCSKCFTYHDHGFYYDVLSKEMVSIELWETCYLHVLASRFAIIEWIRSTGMKPYLDSLGSDTERSEFEKNVLTEVDHDYPLQHDGKVFFPFKRLFVIGQK